MSKNKYKVEKGLARVLTTGEIVYVNEINEDVASVVRPVVTQAYGIEHRIETFPVEQLETLHKSAKRSIEFDEFVQELRMEAEKKRYALPEQMKAVLLEGEKPSLSETN